MTRLNHVRRGDGEPLLLLHALGGSLEQWAPVLDPLARERDVFAVDLPGFGGSPSLPHRTPSTPNELARAVLGFAEELGFGPSPGVAGISLGGWVAIECARERGAGAVVALCPAGFTPKRVDGDPAALSFARVLRPFLFAMHLAAVRRRALSSVMRYPERMSGSWPCGSRVTMLTRAATPRRASAWSRRGRRPSRARRAGDDRVGRSTTRSSRSLVLLAGSMLPRWASPRRCRHGTTGAGARVIEGTATRVGAGAHGTGVR